MASPKTIADWWNPNKEELKRYAPEEQKRMRACDLVDECAAVENRQRSWHLYNLWNALLLTGRELPGFNWGLGEPRIQELTPANLATENFVLMGGDTMLARAMSSPLKPTPVPIGSSFETRRLVRKLDRWCWGTWRKFACEMLSGTSFLDSYISGKGVLRADYDKKNQKLRASSIFFDNYIVDNSESCNRAAPLTHRVRMLMPRQTVEQLYKVELDDHDGRTYAEYRQHGADWVPVVEAWRVGPGGYHMIATQTQILKEEKWEDEEPGLVVMDWGDNVSGALGRSGVELAVPYQMRQNELNEVIRDAEDICARPRMLVHSGSRFDQQQADNVAAKIWMYTGIKPESFTWNSAVADLHAARERNGEMFLRFFGTSEMTAQSVLPPGVRMDSSAAVKEVRSMEDQRFLPLWMRYEKFRIDFMRLILRTMARAGGELVTTFRYSDTRSETIKWSEVKDLLEGEHYTWAVEALPASAASPAMQRQVFEDRIMTGRTDKEYDKEWIAPPDVMAIERAEAAGCQHIDWLVEELEEGRWQQPDPIMNLVYGIPRVQGNYLELLQCTAEDAPNKKKLQTALINHRKFLRVALALTVPPQMQSMAPAPPMPAPETGMGGFAGAPAPMAPQPAPPAV